MECGEVNAVAGEDVNTEYRVCVSSKKEVIDLINRYKQLLATALHEQPEAPQHALQTLTQELLANFEAGVQINVLVNGLPWDEAPDDEVEEEVIDLESVLDETIVETTRRRSKFPKHILPHVVHALKAQRKILGLYEKVVKPEAVTKDADQDAMMDELSAAAPGVVRETIRVIKSIFAVQKQAEGLRQVLNMRPSSASLEVHREVFGPSDQSEAPPSDQSEAPSAAGLKRAMEASSDGYVPRAKKTECMMGKQPLD
ncbi:kinetochore-associated protein NSL1 homolog [Gouania willdenowi]|uniref:NSL1 component of MIS12 kinetochore complex n=1 Tax=Gouania willdenowi TaxID=441366 RepID=A0A8C5G3T3_GOUWI|nr:kinetochore-associated protein NSL1 homolog [Gouania willdenowi]